MYLNPLAQGARQLPGARCGRTERAWWGRGRERARSPPPPSSWRGTVAQRCPATQTRPGPAQEHLALLSSALLPLHGRSALAAGALPSWVPLSAALPAAEPKSQTSAPSPRQAGGLAAGSPLSLPQLAAGRTGRAWAGRGAPSGTRQGGPRRAPRAAGPLALPPPGP